MERLFAGKDGAELHADLSAFLKRPEHRELLEEQQRDEFSAAQKLRERAIEASFVAKFSALDWLLQKKWRPVLQHLVLRRLLISISNSAEQDFQSWLSNPRVLEMFTQARRLLRRGQIHEAEMERILLQYLTTVQTPQQRGVAVALPTAALVAPLNEQLEERAQGNAAYRRRDFARAMHHYDRALSILNLVCGRHPLDQTEIDQCRREIQLNMAAVQMQKGHHGAAIELCTRVLETDPDNVKALERRARAYDLRHEPEAARSDRRRLRDNDQ